MNEHTKVKIIEEYWLNRLNGRLPKINLPIFQQTKSRSENLRGNVKIELPVEIRNVLKKVSNGSDIALLILVLTGLQVGLHRYTGLEDLVIGTVPPKKASESSSVIFYRNLLSKTESFKELVSNTKQILLEGFAYSQYNFAELFAKLQERNAPEPCEILNVALIYNRIQSRVPELEQFELLFILNEIDEILHLTVEYNALKYEEELINLFCNNLLKILSSIPDNLEKYIGQIDILSEEERKGIFHLNKTEGTYPLKTLHELFEDQVEKTPDHIALVYRKREMTYREIDERSSRLATILNEKGARPGKIVGLLSNICHEFVIGILAVLKTGGAYMPLNPEDPSDRINYMLTNSGAEMILYETALRDKVNTNSLLVELKDYPNALEVEENFATLENLAYVIYTSGSTGQPKGVMIEHRNVINQLIGLKKRYMLLDDSKHILLAAPTFDPSIQQIFWPLLMGGQLHLVDNTVKNNPRELLKYIVAEKIDVVNTVPSLMNLMLNYADAYPETQFKMIIIAGEVFSIELYKRIRESFNVDMLINIYGPTEATINTTIYECNEAEMRSSIPIGLPLMNYSVWILDEEANLLPLGVPGEIYISGTGLARGYITNPELTKEKFIHCPFRTSERMYRTGDIARYLPDGNIEFVGRVDHQVKINGIRIELGEISTNIVLHPAVQEAVVLDCNGSYLCAFIICDEEVEGLRLKEFLSQRLPLPMVPSTYIKIDSIPLTANGKIDRKVLLQLQEVSRLKTPYFAPEDEIERELIIIWQQILELDRVGILDNFYELGGNSLKTITMIAEIHKKFEVKLEVAEIFAASTIREIKKLVSSKNRTEFQGIQPIDSLEYYEITPSQKRMWIMDELKSQGETYNIFAAYHLAGQLQLPFFKRSLKTLLVRHESFRTTFLKVDGEVKQKIHQSIDVPLDYLDFRNYSDAETRAREVAEKESVTVFDLETGPLIRIKLIRLDEERHVFLLTLHHIIADTWSMRIIFKELLSLYEAFSTGIKNPFTDLRLQYKDYANWLNNYHTGDHLLKNESYWLKKLGGDLPVIDLPSDRSRKEIRGTKAKMIFFTLQEEMVEKIDEISQKNNLTLFMTLFTSYAIWLYKYTDERDIIVNCLTAGRNHKDLESIVGFFVNTLPIRVKVNHEDTFIELLIKVKKDTLGSYEHQLYNFDQIVDKLKVKRNLNRSPISDIDFSVGEEIYRNEMDQLTELQIDNFHVYRKQDQIINVDISFEFIRTEKEIKASIKYNTDLFDKPRVELMKKRYLNLLENLLNKPEVKVGELDFLIAEEHELERTVSIDFDL
ncbi:non-ribosomal peptide synthetase [Chengkuizengella marina]|uniref:Amino acid adenylation domain-containing protein n=1 Tax=Chengkuizengella marina TaxID=2507566 RepID=A0A6N9Q7D9_9BACL|nr:non-ribosomal peptide synthetase [Chengkuizengella marina]NBI30768.1 amino acid adenylation domain-containing protein [Chengkuizengella marina]